MSTFYTAKERLEIYQESLEDWSAPLLESEFDSAAGFCDYFRDKLNDQYFGRNSDSHFATTLPELFAQSPNPSAFNHYGDVNSGWGNDDEGREIRVKALRSAIELVKEIL